MNGIASIARIQDAAALRVAAGDPLLRDGWTAIDRYTSPRQGTDGDLQEPDYVLSLIHGVGAGFTFMGWRGVAVTSAAAVASTFATRHTGWRPAGFLAGAAVGAAVGFGLGQIGAAPPMALAISGALLGGLQALGADREAEVRDASEAAVLVTGLFLPAEAKVAGAIGAGAGAAYEDPATRAAVAVGCSAAIGAACGLLGMSPAGPAFAAAISAVGGLAGAFVGPRLQQGVRNLANDSGKLAGQGLQRVGLPVSEKTSNMIGAFPATFLREGLQGLVASDFSAAGFLAGGAAESLELAYTFYKSSPKATTPTAAASPTRSH